VAQTEEQTGKAIALSIFAFACFSISDGLRKYMSQSYEITDILLWQGICGGMLIVALTPFMGGLKQLVNARTVKWQFFRGVLIATNTSFSLMAISKIPIVDAYTIFFLVPFVVTIMGALLFKEEIGKFRILSICLGFLGAFIAYRPGFVDLQQEHLYAFVCVFTFSSSSVLARYIGRVHGLLSFAFWPFVCLVTGLLIYSGGHITYDFPISFYLMMTFMGAAYGAAMLTIAYSFTLAQAAVLAPYQYVQIIFALGFGYFLFGDIPDLFKMVGASIIIGSGIFLFARERAHMKRTKEEASAEAKASQIISK